MQNSIVKNTAFITVASIGQKIISFAYFTLIARQIGAEGTGKYFFALAFTTVFVVFVDLGFTNVLVREVAKAKEKAKNYFSTILSAKILFGILTYLAAVITVNLLGYPAETRHLVYLSAVTMLFDSLNLSIYGVLRALGNLKYEALGIVGSQLLTLVLGTTFLYLDFPLIYLIAAFTIPSFLNACFAGSVLYKKYSIGLRPRFDREAFGYLGRIAIPFALAAIFARVYSYIDSILLSKLAGNIAVGWYSIPYKITFAFQFIPMALIAALYPRFSEYFVHDKSKLAYVFERGMKYLMIIVFPIAVGIFVLAKDIVLSLYTAEYVNSILPLKILIISLIFSYLSFPIGAFLNACNRQTIQTVITAIILALNIILNLYLIPIYGVVGAASAAFVGNVLLMILGYLIVPKIVKVSHGFLLKSILQVAVAAGIMGLVVWQVNARIHYLGAIVIGAVVYLVMLFITRGITRQQIQEAIILVRSRKYKVESIK